MHDCQLVMQVVHAIYQLTHDFANLSFVSESPLKEAKEVSAFKVFQDNIQIFGVLIDIDQPCDIGVSTRSQDVYLVHLQY
jgi:hypothetical protein